MVNVPNANRLTVGIMTMVAEEELRKIRERTKAALAAAKAKGKKLGGRRLKFERDPKGNVVRDAKGKPVRTKVIANGSDKARAAAVRAIRERADNRAADLAPTIKALQAIGATSTRAIAAALNQQGIPAARGGEWTATQVWRVLERIGS